MDLRTSLTEAVAESVGHEKELRGLWLSTMKKPFGFIPLGSKQGQAALVWERLRSKTKDQAMS